MEITEAQFKSAYGGFLCHLRTGLEISSTFQKGVWVVLDTFTDPLPARSLFKGAFVDAYKFFTENISPNLPNKPFPDSLAVSQCLPLLNEPVIIWTNWKPYRAKLTMSEFGGVEFSVICSTHKVQLTTVKGWATAVKE